MTTPDRRAEMENAASAIGWIARIASVPVALLFLVAAVVFASRGFRGEEGEDLELGTGMVFLVAPVILAFASWRPKVAGWVAIGVAALVPFLGCPGPLSLLVGGLGALFVLSGVLRERSRRPDA
jgi:hypothetical protein